jgi:hypothetical protein
VSRFSQITPVLLSLVILVLYYIASLFVFLYRPQQGEIFLATIAALVVGIGISKKYYLLFFVNTIVVALFLLLYFRTINMVGVACALAFLLVSNGIVYFMIGSRSRAFG